MRFIWIPIIALTFSIASCGKSGPKSKLDTEDTLSVEEMEQELKNLENESARIDEQLDSINNEIDKDE